MYQIVENFLNELKTQEKLFWDAIQISVVGRDCDIDENWCEHNVTLKLVCCIQCRALLSSKTLSLQLQLLMLKL